jgi:putative nucleotidyltransferase with HDIG domain
VALSFSLLLVILSGVIALSLIRYEWIFLTDESEKRVRAIAENLAVNARDPMLTADDLRFGPVTESTMLDEDVRYAYLVDHRGRIIYHSDPLRTGQILEGGRIPAGDRNTIQAVIPMNVEDVQIGTAVVGLGAEHITRALKATLRGLLLPLLAVTGIGIVAIFFLSGLHVRKIEVLESAVQAVGSGDLLVQVDVRSRDEVGRLTSHFNEMVLQINEARREREESFRETISALAAAVEAKDAYTRGHCERVSAISSAIARRMGMEERDQRDLELAAILHDIGKIGIKGGIIGKNGPLAVDELGDMKRHPDIGARILGAISTLGKVALYVKHHHEHFDGSGYPDGLAGDDIPLASRIVNLVDAYDAMTTNRSYRSALSGIEAARRIMKNSGSQFDPEVVKVFLELKAEGLIEEICARIEKETQMAG